MHFGRHFESPARRGALLPLGVTPLTASLRVDLRVVPGKHELPEMPAVRERRTGHSGRAGMVFMAMALAGAALWLPAAAAGFDLPAARTTGPLPLEAALAQRQSRRSFAAQPLTAAEAGQLLWSAQGENRAGGGRTAPSAGATYPLVLYLVAGRVEGLAAGVYRYAPQGHRLAAPAPGDARAAVAAAARGQAWVAEAPAIVVIAAEPSRTAARYGARAERYVAMEAGAAAQNLQLQAVALGLGATLVGAFDDSALRVALPLAAAEQPLAVLAVGRPR